MERSMILSGWREQYDRMRRSYERLTAIAAGRTAGSSDEARDALFHFFQDAYHLKDWIKNDPAVMTTDVEGLINNTDVLRLCADLCNGTKHFQLTRARTGDVSTAFTSQSVSVRPAAAGSGEPPRPALHKWSVSSYGKDYEALALAADVVRAWQQWLQQERLLP
jgi:hypothetical protein